MDTKEKKKQGAASGSAGTATRSTGTSTKSAGAASRSNTPSRRKKTPARNPGKPASRPAAAKRTGTAAKRTAPAAKKPVRRQRPAQSVQAAAAPAPEVVYTPAKPFNRNRLLLQLATVVAVVLALTFGISIFFKVEKVTVSGANKYSAWTVQEASGISIGDNLLTFGKAKASGRITAALPYVESVRIGIKLPNTVNIEIKELDVVYSVKDSGDSWWLITSEGRVVDRADNATAGDYTKILGVTLEGPVIGQQAVAQEPTAATDEAGETIPVTVRGSDRLSAVLSILQYLEHYGIIGEAASVDVSDLGNIELWYGQQYQVKLGDTTQLKYKINCMNSAINGKNGLKEYDSGILDISFFVKEDQIVYEPFS